MGPSGAGKSTLMDILAMRKSTGHVLGAVLVDGALANSTWLRRTTYVPQRDNFVPVMTAHEVGDHQPAR
jgi:ABC-type multidrug transport system ATPase subunit